MLDGLMLPRRSREPVSGRLTADSIVYPELVSREAAEAKNLVKHPTCLTHEGFTENRFLGTERFAYEENLRVVRPDSGCVSKSSSFESTAIA
jgi:hypothetical protein